jgi:hypothetical protein
MEVVESDSTTITFSVCEKSGLPFEASGTAVSEQPTIYS